PLPPCISAPARAPVGRPIFPSAPLCRSRPRRQEPPAPPGAAHAGRSHPRREELPTPSGAAHVGRSRPRRQEPPAPAATCSHAARSEEHTSELQSRENLVCRLLLEKKTRV